MNSATGTLQTKRVGARTLQSRIHSRGFTLAVTLGIGGSPSFSLLSGSSAESGPAFACSLSLSLSLSVSHGTQRFRYARRPTNKLNKHHRSYDELVSFGSFLPPSALTAWRSSEVSTMLGSCPSPSQAHDYCERIRQHDLIGNRTTTFCGQLRALPRPRLAIPVLSR